jgi:predicted short-subunit dehydrogenase-like oxidoreductase (DUF2520 family)
MGLTFAIIGPGSVGSVLRRSIERVGLRVGPVLGRHDGLDRISAAVDVVFICTPDDQVAVVAQALAERPLDWSRKVIAHVSGALTSEALAPLSRLGAGVLSFHPLSSYPPGSVNRTLSGTSVAIEGSRSAVATMTDLARTLGADPIVLSAEQKGPYHLAASMASNFLVTLQAAVGEVLTGAELDPRLMDGLIRDTLDNASRLEPHHALTGPITRGDVATVRLHVETIQTLSPGLLPLYQCLARATADVAIETGKIHESVREAIEQALCPESA